MKETHCFKKACLLASWIFFSFYPGTDAQAVTNAFTIRGIYSAGI
jgi:hypothetical protein